MPKFFDISLPLQNGMVVWPRDIPFNREESKDSAIVSKLTLSTHTGTHIDAPRHFIFNRGGVDAIALEKLVGPAKVFTLNSKSLISKADLVKLPIQKGDRVIFKTRNSRLITRKSFTSDYVSLSLDAAKYLAAKKISLVGTDYYGIEAKSAPGHPVHKALLRAGIVIVEGLNLSHIKPGKYNFAALPLKIKNSDGSPCRAILWK